MSLKLPLSKKSDAAPAFAPNWHPNFRNFERLPDTKVVRTAFFVNAAALSLAVALLGWVAWREYQVHNLNQQTAAAEAEIARNQAQNNEGLRLTKLFTDEEKKVMEAAAFVRLPIMPSELVLTLGRSLPAEVQLDSVEIRYNDPTNRICILRGLVAGTKDEASGSAAAYVERLKTLPELANAFESVNLTTITTDPRTGLLGFEVLMRLKPEAK
jgi:hypothetical protein